jgi:HAD superfamily hydrolase (TIGR01548 family)
MSFRPSVIVFDVDGVLVDTRESFQRTTLEIVELFTGKRVTRTELHRWKNRQGFNDDWKLAHRWVQALGGKFAYEEVKRKFQEIYWGENGAGNVSREKWLLPVASLRRLGKTAELDIFTGRVREELDYTLDRWKVREFFRRIVAAEDVERGKPHPEGLLKILNGRSASCALYVGDNVDDALAAQSAAIAFVGVLRRGSEERRERGTRLRDYGAQAILSHIRGLEAWQQKSGGRG